MRPGLLPGLLVFLTAVSIGACGEGSPSEPSSVCSYSLTSTAQSFDSPGGTGTVNVETAADCGWAAKTSNEWITFTGASTGTGPGAINLSVAPNPTQTARVGAVTIGGQVLSIAQAGGTCTFDVSPQSGEFPAEGGTGALTITAPSTCPWTVSTTESWLSLVSGTSGSGNGVVSFTVASHTGAASRVGTIKAAGFSVQIRQLAVVPPPPVPVDCSYVVAPTEMSIHWHDLGGQTQVSTVSGCTWTVSAGDDWLNITTPTSSAGSGVVQFTTSRYSGPGTRRAPVQVRWPTVTAGQNVWITQSGCSYAVSPNAQNLPVEGGTAKAIVLGTPVSVDCMVGCPWTAVSQAPWIHIVTGMPRAGDEQFTYQVDANTTGQARVGRIQIETASILISQAGN